MVNDKLNSTKSINRIRNKWKRPWNIQKFDDLYNRDERFFSILIKGAISYLNNHIKMYDTKINHFILNTGSSYMYVENNGYEFSWNETSGEDYIYMQMPRCIVEIGSISIPQEELSQSFARGNYERRDGEVIKEYNAEIKRIPIEVELSLHYVFGTFNESIVVLQELIDKMIFQQYFNITYLGNIIRCSIEFPTNTQIQLNKIDFSSTDVTQKSIDITVTICSNYPLINEHSEIPGTQIISKFGGLISDNSEKHIVITIDGVEIYRHTIFIDCRKFDLNNDGKIDENEIEIIREFIERFDTDNDGEITTHDIQVIEEDFINNVYNIKYDVLNIGTVNNQNLVIIKHLFDILDINKDEVVNKYEITTILKHIELISKYDFNNDLKIDYDDIVAILNYLISHENLTYDSLWEKLVSFCDMNIFVISEELYNYILEIVKTNITDAKIAIEYYINQNNIEIDNDILVELYKIIDEMIEFSIYDINNTGVISKDIADTIMNEISEYSNKEINYYVSSNIIIHSKDHTLSDSSITDTETMKNF